MLSALSYAGPFSVPLSARRMPINCGRWHIKAMNVDQGRDNLDHLQRAGLQQNKHSQPTKRRVTQPPPLGIWDRFPTARTLQQMMDTMDRIMEDPIAYSGAPFPSLSSEDKLGSYRRGRTPWEIKEREEEYRMRFDMPGMTKKDVKLWVEEKMLVIKAEKLPKKDKEGEEADDEDWSATSYGRYNSRIALPENVVLEKIKAEVKDGVLYITIPKALSSGKVVDIDVQ